MSRILPIPADAVRQIHSSKQITSLRGVILSLLENSLDAGASKVDITVDFRRGNCTIEDNGCGIPPAEFQPDGGVGRVYHTSKLGHEIYGSTGTYLASLAALSLLTITSRHRDHQNHATLVLHRGAVVARHVPAPSSHEIAAAHGTHVIVHDLFGNMPVRVKQRVLSMESGGEDERAWQEIKRGIAALLLALPRPCAVKLKDVHCESRTAKVSAGSAAGTVALTEKTLNHLAGRPAKYDFRDALPVLFQAGLAPYGSRHQWVPVSASAGNISVKGAICLDPAPTKQCQFVSFGILPCSAGGGFNDLYESINRVFGNSSFGAVDDAVELAEAEKLRRKNDRRYKNDGYTQQQLKGRKGVDRHPMFVLQLRCRDANAQRASVESRSDVALKGMVGLLEATAEQWLAAHHFRPQRRRKRKNEEQEGPAMASSSPSRLASPADSRRTDSTMPLPVTPMLKRPATSTSITSAKKRRTVDSSVVRQSPSVYFNGFSRIKSGRGTFYDELGEIRKPFTAPAGQTRTAVGTPKAVKHPFSLTAIEAGELSVKVPPRALGAMPLNSVAGGKAVKEQPAETILTSDDFGSVDDNAFIEAITQTESRHNALNECTHSAAANSATTEDGDIPDDAIVTWTDPVTKQTYQVNSRTGVVLPARPKSTPASARADSVSALPSRHRAAIDTTVSSTGQALSLARRKASVAPESTWLHGFLKDWQNPVFQKQSEQQIPIASFAGPGIDVLEACSHRCTDHALTQYLGETGDKTTSKLTKADLQRARVIRQVDEKFVLCSMPAMEAGGDGEMLVLVDQHAASERVILEGLLEQLCSPADPSSSAGSYVSTIGCRSAVITTLLERPQRFVVSEQESALFAKHAQRFADWGILYGLLYRPAIAAPSQVREAPPEHMLIVQALPPGIAERCTLLPNVLIELLRAEIWSLPQTTYIPRVEIGSSDKAEHDWLRGMGSCPKGVLDMLNSRACRSAIMFNDVLSVAQCQELLADLSRCAFPFMCAHGRVSMVPLVSLGLDNGIVDGSGLFAEQAGRKEGFADAFLSWKGRDSRVDVPDG